MEIMGKGGKKLNPLPVICTEIAAAGRGSADEGDGATMRERLAIRT